MSIQTSETSWDEIVRTHSARVYHFAYRLTGNRYDAEDLAHDVFLRVFRYLHTYQPNTFEGWLYRITTNLYFDQYRRRTRFRDLTTDLAGRPPTHEPDPAQLFDAHSLDQDILSALAALDPRLRAAVVLRDLESLTYREIATLLNIQVSTVGTRLHRAHTHLRTSLAHRHPKPRTPPPAATAFLGAPPAP